MTILKLGLLCGFDEIFYDETPLSPEAYLTGINRDSLLKLASFLLGIHPTQSKFNDWKELLNMWFRVENADFANKIWKRCDDFEKKEKTHIALISPIASLKLFEFAFSVIDVGETQSDIASEVSLFKAYSIFINESTRNETASNKYLEGLDVELRPALTLLNQTYPVSEFVNYNLGDIFTTQLVKSYLLLTFLESNIRCQYLMDGFYQYFKIKHWREYFAFIIPIISAYSKHPSEGWTQLNVEKNENFEKNCCFLDSLSLKEFDSELNADFKLLRGNPLFKREEGLYAIISPLFVTEKIFKGLYFKLKEINDLLSSKEEFIKDLRSFYTLNFSENYLLYSILNYIYSERNYLQFSGEELLNEKIDGAPDFYIRNGKYMFLFESKDIFINADIKQSGNFQLIEAEFKKKLFFDSKKDKIVPKAVLQIISNIRKALRLENKFDFNYKPSNIIIYPILIVHDSSFNSMGLNYLINYWFTSELSKLATEGINVSKVKKICIINIDTLILYSDLFKMKKIILNECIDAYIKYGQFNANKKYNDFEHFKVSYAETLIPFSSFIDKYTDTGFNKFEKKFRNYVLSSIVS